MGLIFLYREGGEWWLRRNARGNFVILEPAGVPAERTASEVHGLVQHRLNEDKVVAESSHDLPCGRVGRERLAG